MIEGIKVLPSAKNFLDCKFTATKTDSLRGSWEYDLSKNELHWSDNQFKLYGFEPFEFTLNPEYFLKKTTYYTDLERTQKVINDALANASDYSFRRRIVKKTGVIGFVETNAIITRNEAGEPLKISGETIDVSKSDNQILDYNNPEFFKYIFFNYKKRINEEIRKYISDEDNVQDISQEIFIKVWNQISKYDPQKASLFTWLLNITKNYCIDYLRSKRHKIDCVSSSLDILFEDSHSTSPANVYEIRQVLSKLKDDQRELIEMLFIRGYTQEEVARLKQIPLGTVKSRSRAGILSMKKLIR